MVRVFIDPQVRVKRDVMGGKGLMFVMLRDSLAPTHHSPQGTTLKAFNQGLGGQLSTFLCRHWLPRNALSTTGR